MAKRRLELLAPAKNLECGIAAIDHGADAVYIGAPSFGARAAAGNSIDDIRQLCHYAHQFAAKVYVTVNTIVYDHELEQARQLITELSEAQVDAVLVQDMAIVYERLNYPAAHGNPISHLSSLISLHASTQTDNRTAEKVRWLAAQGFSRVVLARELSVQEIAAIHREVPQVELEVFVHGALCVSYSGQCYASQHCFGRSANRGECAQFCRMKFDLVDNEGHTLMRDRHLLSLKDLNQSQHLSELIEAGATSFKIEGRLKDVAYVKNVTAAYSQLLNQYITHHADKYERASRGHCRYTFTPDLRKTFNRGYTTYFLHGRQNDIASFDTPKAMGEFVGTVKEVRPTSFTVAGTTSFSNGDGLCFIGGNASERYNNANGTLGGVPSYVAELQGFRINRAEGNRLFPQVMPKGLRPGLRLYRNNDQQMERLLSRPSAERKIPVTMALRTTDTGFELQMDGVTATIAAEHQEAQKPQRDNIVRQLSKLGGTPYECDDVDLPANFNYFIPSSLLAELRRKVVALALQEPHRKVQHPSTAIDQEADATAPPSYPLPYLYNVANKQAKTFYARQGVTTAWAYELQEPPMETQLLMQCRYCLRHALGHCVKHGGTPPTWREPLFLRLGDGRRFRLTFNCKECEMLISEK